MGKANPIYTNFSAGEWSARMEGRIDLDKYYSSCRTLENMIVVSQGGADFRPGTKFITNGKTDALKVRLIPFSIKGVGEYIVELGNLYARFIKCSTHAQLMDGANPVEIVTPWPTAALFDIKYKQSKSAIYFTHPSYPPQVLTRTNDTTWVLSVPVFSGWDESTKKYITNITQAAPPVVTSVGHTYITNDIIFIVGVFGMSELNNQAYKIIRINDDTYSLNNIDATTYNPYVSGGTSRKAANIFGSADNYPASVGFYEQRVVLGGTNNIPDGIWFSEPGEFLNFKMPEGLYFKVSHNRGLAIEWLAGKGELIFGADTCEGIIRGGPLVYNNFQLKVESGHGSHNIQGQLISDRILFVQAGGRRIREFAYHDEAGGWESPNLTHFADHITGDGITEMMVQTNPDTILWCVRSDGVLAALTYEHMYGVVGWSRIILANDGDAAVESLACVRGSTEDEVYISVKRTVNEVTSRFIEYFAPRDFGSDQADAYFVDCGITWDGGDAVDITDITQADPPVVTSAGHPFSDGDLLKFMDVVGSDEGYVDFRDFAETDEGDAITVDSAVQITVDELYRDEEGLLYRHLGHEFLDDAFEYTLKVTLDAFPQAGWSMCGVWGVSDVAKHLNAIVTDDNNGLAFIARRADGGDYKLQMWEVYGGEYQQVTFDAAWALATPYYVKITRTIAGGTEDAGTLTMAVYSDAAMTTLLETQTISLHTVVNYEYIYAAWNYIDEAHHEYASYTLENLSGPANRGSYNHKIFKVDSAGADDFELDDEDDNDINGYHYEKYVSGGTVQKVIQTVPGLGHLVGESVAVLIDGSTHSEEIVSAGGTITLDRYGNKIHAGLGYVPWLKPARPEAGGRYGVAQGKKKRISKLILRVYKSLNCLVGPDENNLRTVLFREGDDAMDSPPALFSGDKEVSFLGPWEREGDILITQETPTPLNILAIMPEIVTND